MEKQKFNTCLSKYNEVFELDIDDFLITNLAATSRFLNLNLSYISDIIVPIFSYYLKEVIFMELWFSEFQSKNIKFSLKVNKVLSIEKSEYQTIAVYENEDMGRILALDNVIQLTTKDEFTYHEMIAHVPNVYP